MWRQQPSGMGYRPFGEAGCRLRAHLGAPSMQQCKTKCNAGRRRFLGARSDPVAGLQRARPRESAPAYSWQIGRARAPRGASDGGDPQRARPASGAPNVSRGQQEARGARQRVALCFGSRGGRARPVPIEQLEPGMTWSLEPRIRIRSIATSRLHIYFRHT